MLSPILRRAQIRIEGAKSHAPGIKRGFSRVSDPILYEREGRYESHHVQPNCRLRPFKLQSSAQGVPRRHLASISPGNTESWQRSRNGFLRSYFALALAQVQSWPKTSTTRSSRRGHCSVVGAVISTPRKPSSAHSTREQQPLTRRRATASLRWGPRPTHLEASIGATAIMQRSTDWSVMGNKQRHTKTARGVHTPPSAVNALAVVEQISSTVGHSQ